MFKSATALCMSLAALAIAPVAHAAVQNKTVDGPSADISGLGNADIGPDGTVAVTYLKKVAATDHVFVARRIGGAWQTPQDVSDAAASVPRVEVGAGGRILVTYKLGADVKAKVATGAGAFGPVIDVASAIQNYVVDMADDGTAYVLAYDNAKMLGFRIQGQTATAVDSGNDLEVTPNADPPNSAENIAVSAAPGSKAVFGWSEADGGAIQQMVVRRVDGVAKGAAATATVPALNGIPRDNQTMNLDIATDAAANAWVTFREAFQYGGGLMNRNRPLARKLAGDTFGAPVLLDPAGATPEEKTDAEFGRLAVSGDGKAIVAGFIQGAGGMGKSRQFGAALAPALLPPFTLDAPNDANQAAFPGIVSDGSAVIAYNRKPANGDPVSLFAKTRTGTGAFGAAVPVSVPDADPDKGNVSSNPFTATDGKGTAIVAYSQGAAANATIRVAAIDFPKPGGAGTANAVVSKLKLSPTTFRTRTTISFRLSEAAKVKLSFEAIKKGRKVGKKCKAPTRKNRKRKSCTRYVKVKTTISVKGKAGANKVSFQGRLSKKKSLKPGRYRLTVTATGKSGKASKPARKNFKLLPAAKKKR